jgi:hypothetical protein
MAFMNWQAFLSGCAKKFSAPLRRPPRQCSGTAGGNAANAKHAGVMVTDRQKKISHPTGPRNAFILTRAGGVCYNMY